MTHSLVLHGRSLSSSARSQLHSLLTKAKGHYGQIERAGKHAAAGVNTVRQYTEAGGTGALLGAMHAILPSGLDIPIPKTKMQVPLDGAAALLFAGIGMWGAGEDYAPDARNIGAAATTVWSFRQMFGFVAAKRKKSGKTVGGRFAGESDMSSDEEKDFLQRVANL